MSLPRRIYVNLVAFVALFVVLVVWASGSVLDPGGFDRTYPVRVQFADATGLRPGVEVTFRGVRVGEVDGVDVSAGNATARLSIDATRELPLESTFAVRRRSAVGEPYVAVEPPSGWDGSGSVIPSTGPAHLAISSRSPLAYGALFDAADALLAEVDERELDVVVSELATALGGRGDELRRIIRGTSEVAGTFAAETEILDTLATELTGLTGILADESTTIGSSIDDLDLLVEALSDSRDDIDRLLVDTPPLATRVRTLLAASEASIRCGQRSAATVGAATGTPDVVAQISRLLRAADTAATVIPKAIFDGPDGRYLSGTFGFAPGELVEYEEFPGFDSPRAVDGCPEVPSPTPEGLVDRATDAGAAGDRSDAAGPDPDALPPRDEAIDLASDVDDATDTVSPLPLIAALLGGLAVLLAASARLIPLLRRRRSKDDPHG